MNVVNVEIAISQLLCVYNKLVKFPCTVCRLIWLKLYYKNIGVSRHIVDSHLLLFITLQRECSVR